MLNEFESNAREKERDGMGESMKWKEMEGGAQFLGNFNMAVSWLFGSFSCVIINALNIFS